MRAILVFIVALSALFATPALAETSVKASDGVRYVLANPENTNLVVLQPGEYRYLGLMCDRQQLGLTEMVRLCTYKQKIQADKEKITLSQPGRVKFDPEARVDVFIIVFGAGLALLMCVLIHIVKRPSSQQIVWPFGYVVTAATVLMPNIFALTGEFAPFSTMSKVLLVVSFITAMASGTYGAAYIEERPNFIKRSSLVSAATAALALCFI